MNTTKVGEALHNAAVGLYCLGSNDDIEIDDVANISEGPDGAWVQAWVWVPDSEWKEDEA